LRISCGDTKHIATKNWNIVSPGSNRLQKREYRFKIESDSRCYLGLHRIVEPEPDRFVYLTKKAVAFLQAKLLKKKLIRFAKPTQYRSDRKTDASVNPLPARQGRFANLVTILGKILYQRGHML